MGWGWRDSRPPGPHRNRGAAGLGLGEGVKEAVREGVAVREAVGERVVVGDGEGVAVGVTDLVRPRVLVPVGDTDGEGEGVGVSEVLGVGLGVMVPLADGVLLAVGLLEGDGVGVGLSLGLAVTVGEAVNMGVPVGLPVGGAPSVPQRARSPRDPPISAVATASVCPQFPQRHNASASANPWCTWARLSDGLDQWLEGSLAQQICRQLLQTGPFGD